MKKIVYIVGSKGIPAKYGGFETFVEKLTECQQDQEIQYYVACMRENSAKSGITADTFEHNGAICYNIDVPNIGPARAIAYDIAALNKAIEMAKANNDQAPIFYVLACRIGPFISGIKKKIKDIGGIPIDSVTKQTEVLVIGQQDYYRVGDSGMSNKQKKALKLLEKGQDIEILSESEFINRL